MNEQTENLYDDPNAFKAIASVTLTNAARLDTISSLIPMASPFSPGSMASGSATEMRAIERHRQVWGPLEEAIKHARGALCLLALLCLLPLSAFAADGSAPGWLDGLFGQALKAGVGLLSVGLISILGAGVRFLSERTNNTAVQQALLVVQTAAEAVVHDLEATIRQRWNGTIDAAGKEQLRALALERLKASAPLAIETARRLLGIGAQALDAWLLGFVEKAHAGLAK